ncbi:wax ester/triacylglycerol synthase domain-containing protein [Nocardia sp. NPDC050406]|uniref:wax ester/triacylglycerol synthase domain-containing protein n=1 Tax=Nocardia sp. NPDC050406 TaxID=3364318 RepID=UPI0037A98C7E
MNSLAPRDATMYWLSTRTRNDLFLLYCFTDTGLPTARLRARIAERVSHIPDLLLRVRDAPANLAYPAWVAADFAEDQFVEHELPTPTWTAVTAALGEILDTSLDATHRPWRLHIFRAVAQAPVDPDEPALVAVLQLSHALADGRRAADIARALFSESDSGERGFAGAADDSEDASAAATRGSVAGAGGAPVSAAAANGSADEARSAAASAAFGSVLGLGSAFTSEFGRWLSAATAVPLIPVGLGRTMIRGVAAYRAQRALAELTDAGELPPPSPGYPPNLLNGTGLPAGASGPPRHEVRMLVRSATDTRTPGYSVTVVVLTAVSLALQRYLTARGEVAPELAAQVPMAVAGAAAGARNRYRDLSVNLAVAEADPRPRAERIAADLTARRTRARHPLHGAQDAVTFAIPAPVLRKDVLHYPIDVLPDSVSGHTVVSSVDRGPADLVFGGGRVRFTAGFPALGTVMRLTHGVHGLGGAITISVHSDPRIIPDPDAYANLLDTALNEVVAALRR